MKKQNTLLTAVICILITCTQCDDKRSTEKEQTATFNRTVGKQIPLDVANRWINLYRQSEPSRTQTDTVAVTPLQLQQLVQQPGLIGIALHHAYDAAGIHRLLLLTVTGELKLWEASQILDAASGTRIDLATAKAWAQNYIQTHTEAVHYHFFGADVFTTILAQANLNRVEIAPAINDEGKPQLILLAVSQNVGARSEAKVTAYDVSSPCPPCKI